MFDRRPSTFESVRAHCFLAVFRAGLTIEIQVNPEFPDSSALSVADKFAWIIGKLPRFLLTAVRTVWIHRGRHGFGGGNNNLLIHTDMAEEYEADGVLEEVLIHEATHTSMDHDHLTSDGWIRAIAADRAAISTYARDYPAREDLAEVVGPFLAIKFSAEKLDPMKLAEVRTTIPNRLRYLESLGLSMDSMAASEPFVVAGRCACGEAHYLSKPGRPWGIFICHCSMCPGDHARGIQWCAIPRASFQGDIRVQHKSEFAERGYCAKCGDPIYLRYRCELHTDWVHARRRLPRRSWCFFSRHIYGCALD